MSNLMIAAGMIILVAGLMIVLSLPSYFTSTHRTLLALLVLVGMGFLISAMMRK